MSSYSDKYFEFKVELKELISSSDNEIKLDFIGQTNGGLVTCFVKMIFNKVNEFVLKETDNRVKVVKVKFMEHGKNAAYYVG